MRFRENVRLLKKSSLTIKIKQVSLKSSGSVCSFLLNFLLKFDYILQEDMETAAEKVANCQKTIALLGKQKQLQSLATLEDFITDNSSGCKWCMKQKQQLRELEGSQEWNFDDEKSSWIHQTNRGNNFCYCCCFSASFITPREFWEESQGICFLSLNWFDWERSILLCLYVVLGMNIWC